VTVRYEPPAGLTPGEAGTLLDNRPDMRDITATLVDLAGARPPAVRGAGREQLFGLVKDREYVLHRLEPPARPARWHRTSSVCWTGSFRGGGSAVALSDPRGRVLLHASRDPYGDLRPAARARSVPRPAGPRAAAVAGCRDTAGHLIVAAGTALSAKPAAYAGAVLHRGRGHGGHRACVRRRDARPQRGGARALEAVLGFEEFLRRVTGSSIGG